MSRAWTTHRGPDWTPADVARLDMLLEAGWSDQAIGQRLGRSATAVRIARKRHGLTSRRRRILTAGGVARRLGVNCSKTVARWIEEGWLKGRRGQSCGMNRMWYVSEDALQTFLADPAYWHLWIPERITDPALRAWAVEDRGERFLTPGEAGLRLGVTHAAVNNWINAGLLPAVKNGNWRIRESDLVAFVPPGRRPRAGRAAPAPVLDQDALILRLRLGGGRVETIAGLFDMAPAAVALRTERLLRCRRCGGRVHLERDPQGGKEWRCLQCGRRAEHIGGEEATMKIAGTVKEIPPWSGARAGKFAGEVPRVLQELAKLQGSDWLDLEGADAKEAAAISTWLHGKQWAPFKLEILKRGLHVYVRPLPARTPAADVDGRQAAGARR